MVFSVKLLVQGVEEHEKGNIDTIALNVKKNLNIT